MSTSTFFTETYGGFRIYFLNDLNGKELLNRLWSNDLFLNIYDYWSIHRHGYLLGNYLERNKMLKKIIRQKLSGDPNLPTYKVFLRMCANGRADFNPSDFFVKLKYALEFFEIISDKLQCSVLAWQVKVIIFYGYHHELFFSFA